MHCHVEEPKKNGEDCMKINKNALKLAVKIHCRFLFVIGQEVGRVMCILRIEFFPGGISSQAMPFQI